MKAKNKLNNIFGHCLGICLAAVILSGCKKLAGLPLQQNEEYISTTIDPHIYISAWDYIKSRALGTSAFKDSILYKMYQGILYSGIDTNEYKKPARTYILHHNDGIFRKSGNTTPTDCYFGKYKVNNLPATKWEDYPKEQVKNYLLYSIMEGEYTFETLDANVEYVKTLMPLNSDTLNTESIITFGLVNDKDSKLRINGFPGSITVGLQVRTAGILSTNGPLHVIDKVLFYQKL